MDEYLPDAALMLIGVMPSKRDFEIARLLGWYRIPLRMAPKIVDVDYLAFYQTSAFGPERKWRIESFAEVRGHELTTRSELLRSEPDHPRAQEEYYKIEIGPIQTRPRPIFAEKWKRITFLYTTGTLFNAAHTVNDLVVRSEDRMSLWRSLREKAEYHANQQGESPSLPDDPALQQFLASFAWFDHGDEDNFKNENW
jgi:hypothetical protein